MSGSSSSGSMPLDTSASVLERAKHPSRDGNFLQPLLTKVAAAKLMPDAPFNTAATFTGAMWASPLFLDAPGGKGIYIAATTGNDVLAFDETTGASVWKKNIGIAAGNAGAWCGNIHPIGILGTPVIDPTPGADGAATIYVDGAVALAANGVIDHHEVHALSAKDGSERTGWPVKLTASIMATNDGLALAFNPLHNQRGALSLVNGILYIPFGGHNGDCGGYHGWVIAIDTKTPTTISAWATRGLGGAIWAAGGLASDGNGVFAVTGNANMGTTGFPVNYSDSEGILRISGMPTLTRSDLYYPARWQMMDQADMDMGSSSPMVMTVPGATPPNYVVTVSKDAHIYFLNSASLGMMNGHVVDLTVSSQNHSARVGPVAYTTASGTHIAITIDRGAMPPGMPGSCPAMPAADPSKAVLMGLTVAPGASPALKVTPAWCTTIWGQVVSGAVGALGPNIGNRSSSPIVTTSDGKTDPIVWVMGATMAGAMPTNMTASVLFGVDGETGATVYSGGSCTGVHQWTVPIAVKGHVVAGGDGHLCSWSPH
jgi:hypothetical protein